LSIAIEGVGLRKSFVKRRRLSRILVRPFERAERVEAVRGVDLAIRRGEIFGLLGPNGAGKTTLLKILSCLVLPDEGRALLDGIDTVHENAVKRRIGLVHTDERSFYWRLSGQDNMRFFARLYDVPGPRIEGRIVELLERVDMLEAADRPFADYSSGMKQRMAIARALLHDPPILLMDEPTRSLDPASALQLRRFVLHELKRRDGKTILVASHNLHEIESMADRVAILVKGKIRHVGTVGEIKRLGVSERRFALELDPGDAPIPGPCRVHEDATSEGVRRVLVSLTEGAELDALLRALIAADMRVRSCDRVEHDLEGAFSRLVLDRSTGGDGEAGGGDAS
jgi:ABC-2 type transport system ATP-binding protein